MSSPKTSCSWSHVELMDVVIAHVTKDHQSPKCDRGENRDWRYSHNQEMESAVRTRLMGGPAPVERNTETMVETKTVDHSRFPASYRIYHFAIV